MFSQEKPGDHEAGHDEENVYSHESAGDSGYSGMEENDQQDGYGPQTLHIRSELPIVWCGSRLVT
jgi:hypothetical protein